MSAERRPQELAGGLRSDAPGGDEIIGATLENLRRAAEELGQLTAVVEALQRSLLPDQLPDLPGISLSARYLAGGEETQVGGDWYDAVSLRDGLAGLAIGDVVGSGVDAAARMARLQNALRAYALEGLRPSHLLERMNGFTREAGGGSMATLAYSVLDPDEGSLTIASAGHPPPLVIGADGSSYAEGPPGTPLGVVPFPNYEEIVIPLLPGTTVLFYTDGLVESPQAPLDEGLEWLRSSAGGTAERPLEAIPAALLETRFNDRTPHDDVAMLAARLDPVPAERLELNLRADPEALAGMRRALARWLRTAGAGERDTYEMLVACGEACANAIAHAYPAGEASFAVEAKRVGRGGEVEIRVRDSGSWRAPRAGSRGRGLSLIEQLTDEFRIERGTSGTVVTMQRELAGGPV